MKVSLHPAAILFVAVVGFVLLALQPFPVLHDYPEWMYQGHIAYSLLSGSATFTDMFEMVPLPVPNAISQAAIAVLNSVVSPVLAGQIWLIIYLLLALLVTRGMPWESRGHGCDVARAAGQWQGAKQLIFLITIAFGPGFFNGYMNFQFGLLLFALFIVNDANRSLPWLFVFSVVIYFSHASVFAGFVIYVVFTEVLQQRRVTALVVLVPTLLMLLWYGVSKLQLESGFDTPVGSWLQWLAYKLYTVAKQGPFHNFILPDGQSLLSNLHAVYLTGFSLNFITAILILCWLLTISWMIIRGTEIAVRPAVQKSALVLTITVLLVLCLLAGRNTLGVVNLGERFFIVVLMLLLLTVPMPRWIIASWAMLCGVVGIVTLLALLSLGRGAETYMVARSADASELESFVKDIYSNSRHKYFNHRLFIYANLGQYLLDPEAFDAPLKVDHESSIVRMRHAE